MSQLEDFLGANGIAEPAERVVFSFLVRYTNETMALNFAIEALDAYVAAVEDKAQEQAHAAQAEIDEAFATKENLNA